MAWFKVDDKLHDHRKARAAGTAAMGVWLLAGSWAADNLTDGFIPATILTRWGRQRDADKLVEVGLWHADEQDGEKGWRFHEWAERQPTRAQKLAERAIKAEAGKIGGLASGRSRREASTKQSATGQVELPSRPVPTPSPSNEVENGKPSAKATALPADFRPSEKHQALATSEGVDLRGEWVKFCDHHRAKGSTFKDWSAALNNWIRRAAEYGGGNVRTLPTAKLDDQGQPILPPLPPKTPWGSA